MNDKMIVVYVAHSYVAQEDQEPNKNELITSLTPIVEKRLDFRLHKNVNALIQEVQMEIQDSYYQIFRPAKQELQFTKTFVYNEDSVTREYMTKNEEGQLVLANTQEAILNVNLRLDSTLTKQERTVYDSFELFGDFGGVSGLLFMVLTPLVGLLIGKRYYFSLFSKIFWVRKVNFGGTDEVD